MIKKLLNYVLILVLILTQIMSGISFGLDQNISIDGKVKALDDMNIFKGDGSGYNLDQKLKRSEAATLIVRLLGKTSEVEGNKGAYVKTKFSDVKEDDWFAPYVGYCSQNQIILGFPDDTFKPNEYITEKAFTQLMLGVLGYKSGTDFDWDTVLKYSLEVGINNNMDYAFKTVDNLMFKRADAVSLMYNSLPIKHKSSGEKVIDTLIRTGLTSMDVARVHGIYKDDALKTEVKSINVTSKNVLRVTFNEECTVEDNNIKVKEGSKEIKISSITKYPDFLEIVTNENLNSDTSYIINFNDVTDNDSNVVKEVSMNFKGFEEPRIVSPYFKISKVSPISKDKIQVSFTHPIDSTSEQVLLYEFSRDGEKYFEGSYKTLSATVDSSVDDSIILTASGYTFDPGIQYTIKIKGDLKSAYGAYLNMGEGDAHVFTGTEGNVVDMTVLDASFYDKDLVMVTFSGPVDKESASNLSNYRLINNKNNLEISPSKVYFTNYDKKDNSQVILRFNGTKSDTVYSIKVKDVYDSSRFNKTSSTVTNTGQGLNDSRTPSIVSIVPIDRQSIMVTFDMRLKSDSENASMYITNSISPRVKVVDAKDPYNMIIYMSKSKYLEEGKDYKLTISGGLVDELDRRQKYTQTVQFQGASLIEDDTRLESATFISKNLIMAKFNKDIRTNDLSSTDKFEFSYKDGSIQKTLFVTTVKIVDSKTVILGYDYSLEGGTLELIAKDYYNITGEVKYSKSQIMVDGFNQ